MFGWFRRSPSIERPVDLIDGMDVTLKRKKGFVELACSAGHEFYLSGHPPFRVGSVKSPIAYVRCPYDREQVAGGRIIE